MMKQTSLYFLSAPVLAVVLGSAPWNSVDDDPAEEIELDEAAVFIEFNSTDGDFGIQFFWDGEPWRRMKVEDEDDRTVLRVQAAQNVAAQGLTEGFFESAEPPTSVLNMQQFFARFPEGEYEFEGRTLNGEELEGETEFTHVLPAPPSNLWPTDGDEVDHTLPLVVSFDAVTQDLDGNPLSPELYEVVVETDSRDFSIVVDGDDPAPSVTIPPEFLDPATEYKFEVIVQEESGNRTISETEFETL